MNLLEQVENLWEHGAKTKAAGWAAKSGVAKESILKAKQYFHEWFPLKIYVCYTDAIKRKPEFSLRYLGQEVATLRVGTSGDVSIRISEEKAAVNDKRFGITLKQGDYHWREADAQKFRRHFRCLNDRDYRSAVRSEEHYIESEFLRHMKDPTGNKFHGTLRGIQPVMLGGLPFQFPVPISGNTGEPKLKRGNIDILARRGTGKGTKISVWELKRPWELKKKDTTAHAIPQAYIYAVTLLKMLRTPPSGDIWYRDIIGFGCEVPEKLTIESVVAVSIADDRKRKEFEDKLRAFKRQNALTIGNDTINLFIAHYQRPPLTVKMTEV